MSAVKIVGGVIAAVATVVVVGGLVMDDSFDLSVTRTIDAPREVVYAHVADLEKQETWSPWKQVDPSSVWTYDEVTEGEGASYSWKGEQSGSGTYTITGVTPPSEVRDYVVFDGMGDGRGTFTFREVEGGTEVTWAWGSAMDVPVFGPWMVLVFNPVGTLEEQFTLGLESLEARVLEAEAAREEAEAEAMARAADAITPDDEQPPADGEAADDGDATE